jgi:molybdopterin-guanine dinucleotide biosynthesis protein A
MGQPKEGVLLADGRRMIEHIIEPLSIVCSTIVIIGSCRGFTFSKQANRIPLPDTMPGHGPLAAITTLLKSGLDQRGYLVTACDQPFLTADLLRLLIQEPTPMPRIFQTGEKPLTPFPGYYPVSWLSEIEKNTEEHSVCALLEKSIVSFVPYPKEWQGCLKNINRPTDLPK